MIIGLGVGLGFARGVAVSAPPVDWNFQEFDLTAGGEGQWVGYSDGGASRPQPAFGSISQQPTGVTTLLAFYDDTASGVFLAVFAGNYVSGMAGLQASIGGYVMDSFEVELISGNTWVRFNGPPGNLTIGANYEVMFGTGLAWSPAALFSGNGAGAWYDPADLATLFQDAAGAIPVSAPGQLVRRVNDKSGNGWHWVAPSDAERPSYQTGAGLHWLDFAGGGKSFVGSFTFANDLTLTAGLRTATSANFITLYDRPTGTNYVAVAQNGVGSPASNNSGSPVHNVSGVRLDPNTQDAFYDAVVTGSGTVVEVRGMQMVGTGWASNLRFGNYFSSLSFNGRFYGAIVALETRCAESRAELLSYMAVRSGAIIAGMPSARIAALGDSTIAFFGPPAVPSFMNRVGAKILANPGDTIAQQRAAWEVSAAQSYDAVVAQVGLNDLDPAEAATVAIARLQALVASVRAKAPTAKILVGQMTPCRARLITLFGGTNGPIAYQKWLDMNSSIGGDGANPITGVDGRITSHVALLNDGSGNLANAYDTGDGIHENAAGRQIIATAWEGALAAAGIIAP